MDLIIDLLNSKRDKKNLGLEWNVSITESKGGFFSKFSFVRSHQHIEKTLSLSIKNLVIADEIVCDKVKLLTIVYAGREYVCADDPIELKIEKENTSFQLFINQNAIRDCTECQQRQAKSYNISFNVELKDKSGKVVDVIQQSIDVKFVALDIKPKILLDFEKDKIQYNSQLGVVQIGEMVAYIGEAFLYTPAVNLVIKLKLLEEGKLKENTLYFGNQKSVEVSCLLKPLISNIQHFPIYMDFDQISNPIQPEREYTIEEIIVQSMEYSPDVIQHNVMFDKITILKDNQGVELKVEVSDASAEKRSLITSKTRYDVDRVSFVPHSRMQSQIRVDVMNIATDSSNPGAGLTIKNFTVSETIRNGVRIVDEDNKELFNLVTISGVDYDALNGSFGLEIKNGKEAKTTLYISFDPSRIADILLCPSYDFQIESMLTFDYWENKDGVDLANVEAKNFKLPIVWNLHLEPHPEWLCVDYGSSAIACKYNKDLIDLKGQKDKIFRSAFDQFRNDEYERGTKFLSSDIVLHLDAKADKEHSSLCSEQNSNNNLPYYNLAVCLSPTSSLIDYDVRTQLPCLKILVGNEYLPQNPDYLTFQYLRKNNEGVIEKVQASATKDDANSILKISSIFREAYSALFRYFISPVTGDNRRLNKLVLTYPNTYTPVHLNVLREIAMTTFPSIREGFLRFVSESDAVAAYYVDHWSEFNVDKDIWKKETVLVYDMGAGTLDVTLFDKFENEEGKIEVNIKGKLGTGKAGNYLDFVLAEIISELLHMGNTDIVSTKQVPNVQVLKERLKLKQAIKSDIKLHLYSGEKVKYEGNTIDMDAVINHPKFITFLKDVTEHIMDQLCQYMGSETLAIDTVIMSGRSCKLQLLRTALEHYVGKVSLGENYFVEFANDGQADRQKTVVVEGSIAQAGKFNSPQSQVVIKSRRLYASYGIIYQELGGNNKYVELLSHNDIPDSDNAGVFESDSVVAEGTSAAQTLYLIQTYLSSDETERRYNSKDFEFISEMEEFDMVDFNNVNCLNVKLRLDYNNNISVFVNGKISRGSTPKGVDLSSEITKRSIWPVII